METPSTFCTCTDHSCPLNPVNHNHGCTPCIEKNLRLREIPSCFFHLLGSVEGQTGFYFEDFAKAVLSRGNSPSGEP